MTGDNDAPVGRCARCGDLVYPHEARSEVIEQGSGVAPDVLLHMQWCEAPYVRRHL